MGGTREQFEQLEYTEPVTVETKDLIDHLREQLQMLTLSPRQLLLAEEFLGNINEEGYLAASLEEIRTVLASFGDENAFIQQSPDRPRQVLIRTEPLDEAMTARLTNALRDRFGGIEVLLAERVGPKIGRELRNQAILAVMIGLLLQIIYISWRFRSVRFALTADIALVHDLIVVIGLYALTRRQVDSSFVAVLLTVVGYSINDTVVVFDRIREIMGLRIRASYPELVNRSILEVLTRSLTTGTGAIMAIVAIYFLGGVTIRDFAFGLDHLGFADLQDQGLLLGLRAGA